MVYVVKDDHLFSITDKRLIIIVTKANQGGCKDLLKHIAEFKWTRTYDKVTKVENIEEADELENHILVLLEEVKMKEALKSYTDKYGFYVGYLHWDSKGVLDGFIDHTKNMFLMNNDYDTRKVICDKLQEIYKTHDFDWCHQSLTAMASALFRQQVGYLPVSSYNLRTRKMLNDYYPEGSTILFNRGTI